MGKRGRPKSLKVEDKEAPSSEIIEPSSGAMMKQLETANPPAETKESAPEVLSPRKSGYRKKAKPDASTSSFRRSQRLVTVVVPNLDKSIEQAIEEVTVSDSEKEEEATSDGEDDVAEPNTVQNNVEDRLTSLEEEMKELKSIVEGKPKDSQMPESTRAVDVSYKSMYFDAQKKIEALTSAHHQLALKMEHALGKLEVYETGALALSEGSQKIKDVIMISNLTRAADSAMNLSPPATNNASIPSGNTGAKTGSAKKGRLPATK